MCSILGGTIPQTDPRAGFVFNNAADRGRDDCGSMAHNQTGFWVANHRATPTTEAETPNTRQPVQLGAYAMVFNGTISNEVDIMGRNPAVDTEVFEALFCGNPTDAEIMRTGCATVHFVANKLKQLKGSFALAFMGSSQFFVACNYKPIHVREWEDGFLISSLAQHFGEMVPTARIPTYTVMDLVSGAYTKLPHSTPNRALVIASAGLDSTVAAKQACIKHGADQVTLLHFMYGCHAQKKEMDCLTNITMELGCRQMFLRLGCAELFEGSTLVTGSEVDVAKGAAGAEYAHEWVPARNLLMIATTVAYAEAQGFGHIYLGTNLEEGGAYPDNEQQFIVDMQHAIERATNEGLQIKLHAPLGNLMKHEIVKLGLDIGAPLEHTWSCYKGGEKHCRECGPCFMRSTAFARYGMEDPAQ